MSYDSQWTKSATKASCSEGDLVVGVKSFWVTLGGYADDVALTEEQITSAQQLLISFEESAAKVGLTPRKLNAWSWFDAFVPIIKKCPKRRVACWTNHLQISFQGSDKLLQRPRV